MTAKRISNGTRVDGITLVLYGEHPELNAPYMVTPVNLGKYSCFMKNDTLYIEDEAEFNKEAGKALRAIMLTYLSKQSEKEN